MNSMKGKKSLSMADFYYSCHCHTMDSANWTIFYE